MGLLIHLSIHNFIHDFCFCIHFSSTLALPIHVNIFMSVYDDFGVASVAHFSLSDSGFADWMDWLSVLSVWMCMNVDEYGRMKSLGMNDVDF